MKMSITAVMRGLDTSDKRVHAFVFSKLAEKDPAYAALRYSNQLSTLVELAPKTMKGAYEIDVLDMQAYMVTRGMKDLDEHNANHASKIFAVMDYRARGAEYEAKGLKWYINDWIRELAETK